MFYNILVKTKQKLWVGYCTPQKEGKKAMLQSLYAQPWRRGKFFHVSLCKTVNCECSDSGSRVNS